MNANKKIEETKKLLEKTFFCSVSYHEEGGWNGKDGHFTIKLRDERFVPKMMGDKKWLSFHWEDIGGGKEKGVLTPIKKNIKILTDFEKDLKVLGNDQPVNFKIEGPDEELKKVSKEEFANWMTEGKDIKTPPKERIIYGASGDIDSITVFTEIRSKDGVIKESYYRPRSEEEKKQIKKRQEVNRKIREQEFDEKKKVLEHQTQSIEKSQNDTSPNFDKQDRQVEKDNNSQNLSQKIDNKDSSSKKVFYGIGVISLIVLAISMIAVWVKKR